MHKVMTLEYFKGADVTQVTLPATVFPGAHVAGQFSWICIPAISPFEYHPFTISSAPSKAKDGSAVVQFSIKSRGPHTWTGKLAELAKSQILEPITISLDGPYGRTINYFESSTLVLVAGGIGQC